MDFSVNKVSYLFAHMLLTIYIFLNITLHWVYTIERKG